MPIFSGVMVYILTWWIVLFCTLPFNIQNITKPEDGSMPGAPVNPGLKKKLIFTTIIAAVVWLAIDGLVYSNLISFREIAARMSM